jgi:anoctamin-10
MGAAPVDEEATGFEVGIVVPKLPRAAAADGGEHCLALLVRELEDVGLLVDRVRGVPAEFIKVPPTSSLLLVFEFSLPC